MPTRVFVSYSHDSAAHVDRVLALAQSLRNDGVDARTDQDALQVPEGWPSWLQRQLVEADHVVLVCTDTYRRRFEGEEAAPGPGMRVAWEGMLAKQILYDAGSLNTKMIPVLFEGSEESAVPLALAGATRHRLPGEYESLYRHITNQPRHVPAPLGRLRVLGSDDANAIIGQRVVDQRLVDQRLVDQTLTIGTLQAPAPIRVPALARHSILLLTANASLAGVALQLEEELREIIVALRGATTRDRYAYEIQPAVDFTELVRLLDERTPTIVHFCGHGDREGLWLKSSASSSAHVAGEHLVQLFAGLRRRPHLVVLAACRSAALAEALAGHVDFAIGYDEQLPDVSAREFSRIFYDRLAARPEPDVAHAFRLAQLALISAGFPGAEHARLFGRHHAIKAGAGP